MLILQTYTEYFVNEFKKILVKQGINFKLGSKVDSIKNTQAGVKINYTDIKNSKEEIKEKPKKKK